MKLSELLEVMEGCQVVEIDDLSRPVGSMTVYTGTIRGIKKRQPNKRGSDKRGLCRQRRIDYWNKLKKKRRKIWQNFISQSRITKQER